MKKILYLITISIVMAVISFCGCNKNVEPEDILNNYTLYGGIVVNLENDSNLTVVSFDKNNSLFTSADISIFDTSLAYDSTDSTYKYSFNSLASGVYKMSLNDSTGITDSVSFTIPFILAITSLSLPNGHENPGGDPVQIEWTTSLLADGYMIAAVKRDSAYLVEGFAEIVTGGTPSATLPLDAFRTAGTLDPDTGWYDIFVYAYTGSPSSDYNLPTAIPAGFSDNIDRLRLAGAFGAIVVSPRDSVHVVLGK